MGPSSRGSSLDLWTPGGVWRVWDRYPGLFLLHWAQDSHLGTFASLTCNVASWSTVLSGIVSILKAASRAKPSFLNDAKDVHVHTCMQLHTQKHTDSFTQAVREGAGPYPPSTALGAGNSVKNQTDKTPALRALRGDTSET